jgi:matrixin
MRLISLWLLVCLGVAVGETPANWTANYPPCNRHSELLKQGHMDLGVRFATANPSLAVEFRRALNSWAKILDLDWHEDDTQTCSIELVDGEPGLFEQHMAARSQFPDRLDFQGWVAFNPAQAISEADLYRIAVHEIGHIFGLRHSSNDISVMYALNLEGIDWLDTTDLAVLAAHHKLRVTTLDVPFKLAEPR